MRIPSPSIHLGPIRHGQSAGAENAQFGRVELVADGKIDDGFKSLPGHHDVGGWRDLGHPGLVSLLNACGSVAVDSLSQARERFEQGNVADRNLRNTIEAASKARIAEAMKEAKIPGSVYLTLDSRGVVDQTSIHLNGNGSCADLAQSLKFRHTPGGMSAVLESRRYDGVHTIVAPFSSDGKVEVAHSTEELTLNTPWLQERSLSDIGSQGIHQLDDPRLERLAAAAEQGFLLPAGELGSDWKVAVDGGKQVWTYGDQQVALDACDRSFSITSTSSHSARGGEVDYDVKDTIQWRGGRMERLG